RANPAGGGSGGQYRGRGGVLHLDAAPDEGVPMPPLHIAVLGTDRRRLRTFEQRIRRLGHRAVTADAAPPDPDVVVVDARDGLDWAAVPDDTGPLLVIADEPGAYQEDIRRRGRVAIVLSGHESDAADMGAIRLCAALRRSSWRLHETG